MQGLSTCMLTVTGQRLMRALYGQAQALPASLFELGISPYVNASIAISMLLAVPDVFPPVSSTR